jgi:hypothetical protein
MMIIHSSINKGTTSMRTTGGPLHQKPLISYVRCSAWINPRYDDEDDDWMSWWGWWLNVMLISRVGRLGRFCNLT